MIITDPQDYRVGDLVLVDGKGPAFTVLSWLLGRFDQSWRKAPRKPWHTAFLSRKVKTFTNSNLYKYYEEWWISEAKGGVGITESPLSSIKEPYLVFRWFSTSPPNANIIPVFIDQYRGEKYDAFWGYLFVILWYFWRRWPFIIDYKWMCWEWVNFFVLSFGKPFSDIHKYPLITIIMDKVGYPGYD